MGVESMIKEEDYKRLGKMNPEKFLQGQPKPTPEQIAFVFACIMKNAGRGSFRVLIYDLLGCNYKDYVLLLEAGGQTINNVMFEAFYKEDKEIIEDSGCQN